MLNHCTQESQSSPLEIEKNRLLLVEGYDECFLFDQICQNLGVDNIQIIVTGRSNKFEERLMALLERPEIDNIKLAVVQDAEVDIDATFQSVTRILDVNLNKYPENPGGFDETGTVGLFIFPDNKNNGCLETLLLSYLRENQPEKYVCIEDYFNCVNANWGNFNKECKAKIHAYLSILSDPDLRFGHSAQRHYWDDAFESGIFAGLVNFIKELAK